MAEPAPSTPPDGNNLTPQFLPPVEQPPPVKMWQPTKRKYPPWLPWLALSLSPVVIVCAAVGAFTIASGIINSVSNASHTRPAATAEAHTQTVKPHATPTSTPTYDLAGYKAAVDGSDEQTFVTALNRFRSDIERLQFQTVTSDAVTLNGAANTYLATVRATNPPPAYQAAKLANITAAIYARPVAAIIQGAISTSNLNALQTGLAEANKASGIDANGSRNPRGG